MVKVCVCGLVKKVCVCGMVKKVCVWYGEGACVWYGKEGACVVW